LIFFKTIISFYKDEEYKSLLKTTFAILLIGSVVYHYVEGWSWVDSFYFSVITLTTIGYGDLSPSTDVGKIFTIFYIISGLGVILGFINAVFHHYSNIKTNPNKSE